MKTSIPPSDFRLLAVNGTGPLGLDCQHFLKSFTVLKYVHGVATPAHMP